MANQGDFNVAMNTASNIDCFESYDKDKKIPDSIWDYFAADIENDIKQQQQVHNK